MTSGSGETCIDPYLLGISGFSTDEPSAVQQMVPKDDRGPPDISLSSPGDFNFDGHVTENLTYNNQFAAPSSGSAEMNNMSSGPDNTFSNVADIAAYSSAQNPHSNSNQYQDPRHSHNSTISGRILEDFQMDSEKNQMETMAEKTLCSQNPSTNPESSISLDPLLSMSCSSRSNGLADNRLCFLDHCPLLFNEAIKLVSATFNCNGFTLFESDTKVSMLARRLHRLYQEHAGTTTQTDQPCIRIVCTVVKEFLEQDITPEEQCRDLVSKVDSLYGKYGWVPKDNGDSGLGSSRGPGLPSSAQPASNCQLPSSQERTPKKRRVAMDITPKPVKSKRKQRHKVPCRYCRKKYVPNALATHITDQHTPTLHFCPLEIEGEACRKGFKREDYLVDHIKRHLKLETLGPQATKKIEEVIPGYRFQVPEEYTSSYYYSCPCCGSGHTFNGWKKSIDHLVDHYFAEHDSLDQRRNLAVNLVDGQRLLANALFIFSAKWRDLPRLGIDYLKSLDEPHQARSNVSGNTRSDRDKGSDDDDSHHGGSFGHISRGSPSTEHGSGHGGHGGGYEGDYGKGPWDGGGRGSSSYGGGTTRKDLPRGGGGNYQNRMKGILAPGAFKRRSPSFFFGERRVALYESIRELGRGGFSVVDEVKRLDTGQIWARKSIPRLFGKNSKVESEINTLKGLDHSHIIKLIDFYFELSRVYLIIAPVAEGDLAIFLRDLSQKKEGLQIYPSELERRTIRKWITCLSSAVGYLHGEGIVHGDIKPRNILISSSEIFLTDFGFSSAHGLTPKYCSPEAVKPPSAGQICGKAGDIFSLGCVYAEMLTVYSGQSLRDFERFRALDGGNTAYHSSIVRCHSWLDTLTVPSDFSPGYLYDFLNVVKSMLSFNPTSRPKIEGLIAHFQNFWPSTSSWTYSIASQSNSDCWCYQSIQVQQLSDTLPSKTELSGKNAHREGAMLQESVSLQSCDNGSNVWPDEIVTQRCVGLLFEVQKPTVQTWDITTGKWISLPENNIIFSTFLLVTSSKHDELLSLYEELANRRLEQAPISLAPRIIAATDTPKDGSFWGFHELEDYFRVIPPPSSAEETIHLWISVFGLLESQKWSRRFGSMKKIPAAVSLFKDLEIVLVHEVQGKSPYEWNFGLSNSPAEYDFHSRVISDQPTLSETRRCRNSSLAAESVNVCISVSMMVLEWIFQHPKTSLSNDKRTSQVRRNVEENLIETLLEEGARCGPRSVTGAVVRNLIKPLLLQVPPRSPTANPTDILHQCAAMAMDVLQHSWRTHITFNITPPLPTKNPKFYVFSISKEFNGEDGSGNEKSEKSVVLYKYPLDRYSWESVDYKSLVVPEHDSVRMASRKLHRRMLELLVKRF